MMSRRLCACLLNISEARDDSKVLRIASAALKVNTPTKDLRATILNIFQDKDYNRSVLTIAASVSHIGESIVSACTEAYSCIDLREHVGGHPRLGAVDLIPIHPISPSVSLDDCAGIAKDVCNKLSRAVVGSSFFFAGCAHEAKQGLVARRKQVGWFKGKHGSSYSGMPYDMGEQPTPRYGLTGVAAIPYVTNCNVTIDCQDLALGRRIAHALRATTPGGFPGVQSMAFAHEGKIEIACNIEGVYLEHGVDDKMKGSLVRTCGDCHHVPAQCIEDRVRTMAGTEGVHTVDEAQIVGFEPAECERLAKEALDHGIGDFWKTRTKRTM